MTDQTTAVCQSIRQSLAVFRCQIDMTDAEIEAGVVVVARIGREMGITAEQAEIAFRVGAAHEDR